MITEDALMKLYPIYHGCDELEMDKLELNIIDKQEELSNIHFKNEALMTYNVMLPKRRMKQMGPHETINGMNNALHDALKGIFHPNSFLHSLDELKLEFLQSQIPSTKGFLLCKKLLPADEQHRNLITNILYDFKYTVVLYRNDIEYVSANLKKEHPAWYQDVKFLVLSKLTDPGTMDYIAAPNHWLNYCHFDLQDNVEAKKKLWFNMGDQHKIFCVQSHADVLDEFEKKSKRHVSFNWNSLPYFFVTFFYGNRLHPLTVNLFTRQILWETMS